MLTLAKENLFIKKMLADTCIQKAIFERVSRSTTPCKLSLFHLFLLYLLLHRKVLKQKVFSIKAGMYF